MTFKIIINKLSHHNMNQLPTDFLLQEDQVRQ